MPKKREGEIGKAKKKVFCLEFLGYFCKTFSIGFSLEFLG
jgi:hypothetical protein